MTMSVINTNIGALTAQQALTVNSRSMSKAMEELSTGKRVNTAADDAAGFAIASKMTSQIRGLNQAVRNANDGISLLQTADGATNEITNMLQRMRELSVQAANDTNTTDDRTSLNLEYQQLMKEITRIADTTQWNGMNILNNNSGFGSGGTVAAPETAVTSGFELRNVKLQVGANNDQVINASFRNFSFNTGTAPTASKSSFNFAIGDAALSGTTSYSIVIGEGQSSSTVISFTASAPAGSVATAAETTSIANAMRTAINARAGFENVSVTLNGKVVTVEDSNGRKVGAITAGSTALTATNFDTEIAAGSPSVGATAPSTNSVFSGNARLNDTDITSATNANTALGRIDAAIKEVNAERSKWGAITNRLNYTVDNLTNISTNTSASRSRIEDTDYAKSTTELARTQIIQQAATAMLAQANQQPQSVLSLLK
jgi:flagellin